VISGAEFGAMSDEEALARIDDVGVIARVSPGHKVRLVAPGSTACRAGHQRESSARRRRLAGPRAGRSTAGSAGFSRAIALDNHPIMSDTLLQD
jgi:hypothetical protein